MGEGKRDALRVDFDGQIRLEFHGANITSDAGLLAYRELDEALGVDNGQRYVFRPLSTDASTISRLRWKGRSS
jgi:hypothetical protein